MRKTLAKAGTGVAILIGLGLVALALGTHMAGALESKNAAWAVIFATDSQGGNAQTSEGLALHNWLLNHGWSDDHIKFLGIDPNADGQPTKENLQAALGAIGQRSSTSSEIFISVLDDGQWGNGDWYFSASNGPVSAGQFANWVNQIGTYKKMAIELSFRYSGGFIPALAGNNRVIVTSHASNENYAPNHFVFSEGLSNPLADTNNDGYNSVQEAFSFEYNKIIGQYPGTQVPQKNDNAGPVILSVA
jgi:hypothetical protein